MKLNIDQLKKKIIYRSKYRGTKEMDKHLGAFTDKYIITAIQIIIKLTNFIIEKTSL